MHPETFRKALAATARVACCSALLGCTPKPPHPTVPPPVVEKQDLAACQTHTRAVFIDTTEKATARTNVCCVQLTQKGVLKPSDDWREWQGCCELIGWEGNHACTPWGPPCPPAMETA